MMNTVGLETGSRICNQVLISRVTNKQILVKFKIYRIFPNLQLMNEMERLFYLMLYFLKQQQKSCRESVIFGKPPRGRKPLLSAWFFKTLIDKKSSSISRSRRMAVV